MKKIFFDIETLPAPKDKHEILKKIYTKKKENGRMRHSFENFLELTNFGGAFGRIFCICYALDDEKVMPLVGDEKEILKKFWEIVSDFNLNYDRFIGHNIMEFDLKFIYQRSIILGVRPTQELSFARYRNTPIFDIMKEWSKWGQENISMDELAHALSIPSSKDKIDGSQVHEYYKKGKYEDILNYCKKDVEVTRAIYKKMTFNAP